MNILKLFKLKGSTKNTSKLIYNTEGFHIPIKNSQEYFYWKDIKTVITYKLDLLATDMVCLSIEFDSGKCFQIHEEIVGWEGFIATMNRVLGLDESWFENAVQPPFARNEVIIYTRALSIHH